MNALCNLYKWVMALMQMSNSTRENESWHASSHATPVLRGGVQGGEDP